MARLDYLRPSSSGKGLRLVVSTLAVVLLPPFLAAAAVPLALLLFPVAWLAIPFIIPALLGDALTAEAKPRPKRATRKSASPDLARALS